MIGTNGTAWWNSSRNARSAAGSPACAVGAPTRAADTSATPTAASVDLIITVLHCRRACENLGTFSARMRSEEHTSELQSRGHLVCRLLLEKKKTLKA